MPLGDLPPEPEATGIVGELQAYLGRLVDGTQLMVEAATGYRNQLVAAGWPEPAAVQIAGQFLISLQAQMFVSHNQATAQPKGKKR